jgi:hypothetical protein
VSKEDKKVNISIMNLLSCQQDTEQKNEIINLAHLLDADVDMNTEDSIVITIITN